MKVYSELFVLFSVVACTLAQNQSTVPSYIECKSNADCNPGNCCVIGQETFSYPQCKPYQAKGEVCRPGEPLLTSEPRFYPGFTVSLSNVSLTLCSCAENLTCSRITGQCENA